MSTIAVSCHGCRYESKYEVLPEASVILQLHPKTPDAKPISTRGRVKWTKRPPESGGLFQTAIELEQPGNIWGIDAPPSDWIPFVAQRPAETDTSKAKPVAVLRTTAVPEARPAAAADPRVKLATPRPAETNPPAPSATRPIAPQVGQLMGGFQQQMEKMLSEGADAAVRERSAALLADMRTQLRAEVQHILAESSSTQANRLVESARTLHGQWTKKIDGELQQALGRMEMRHRELEELSERLTAKAHDRLETFIEGSRKEAVDKIVVRLKEQSAPVIESARKAASELTRQEQQLEKLSRQFIEKSAEQMEETCTRLDQQFEMILRERIDSARDELDVAVADVSKKLAGGLQELSEKEREAVRVQVHEELSEIARKVIADVREKGKEMARQFGGELSSHSRNHLEYVSGAISELAKGIGKFPKD
ncbi:MAG TPA: hypothetical protein VHX36_02950 [Candidatus Acidoferrales bacterium]|nr:hypothetical protein [Candidatus Acidoferrales bacterium]